MSYVADSTSAPALPPQLPARTSSPPTAPTVSSPTHVASRVARPSPRCALAYPPALPAPTPPPALATAPHNPRVPQLDTAPRPAVSSLVRRAECLRAESSRGADTAKAKRFYLRRWPVAQRAPLLNISCARPAMPFPRATIIPKQPRPTRTPHVEKTYYRTSCHESSAHASYSYPRKRSPTFLRMVFGVLLPNLVAPVDEKVSKSSTS